MKIRYKYTNVYSVFLALLFSVNVFATDYTVSFTGSGASAIVEKVLVRNLTKGTEIQVSGADILHLTNTTDVKYVGAEEKSLKVYPNPVNGPAFVSLFSACGGNAYIRICTVDGKCMMSRPLMLDAGLNQFGISLPKGVFTIQVNEDGVLHNARVVSQSNGGEFKFEVAGNGKAAYTSMKKVKAFNLSFNCDEGDLLLFKGYSGNNSTIVTDIVTASKVINFKFVECKDADGNYYPTVTIGSQTWMAENLKTTRYRNSVAIPNKSVYPNILDAYSNYETDASNLTYGKLYNWYAVTNANNIAPEGWHVPSDAEWNTLSNYLGGTMVAGNRLKESGSTHWTSANSAATNLSGFSALPGGVFWSGTGIQNVGTSAYLWSSTPWTNNYASWYWGISNLPGSIAGILNRSYQSKIAGMSVRCILDEVALRSIYDQLKKGYSDSEGRVHTFNNYVHLIDDLGFAQQFKDTANQTLFASDDDAFTRFFQSNSWGVRSYENLTNSQKKLILHSSMLWGSYPIEFMSNYDARTPDVQILRSRTRLASIDSVCLEKPESLPKNNNNWDAYREKGVRILKDNTFPPMVHFLQKHMDQLNITDEDFSILFNGLVRTKNDAHVFGNKVEFKDVSCANGYIHILKDVLVPPSNMAQIIGTASETKLFSTILEKFSAPYYSVSATQKYKQLYPEFNDSIFEKKYFSQRSSSGSNLANPSNENQKGYLIFDPGWNTYTAPSTSYFSAELAIQRDMGAIFVPSDTAMNKYFSKGGKFLIDKFGKIENIPNYILDDLVNNHMNISFLNSLPGKFADILDDARKPMGIGKSNIRKTYVANNGAIYVTDKVFAPASWSTVVAPISVNDNSKIFDWAVYNCPDKSSNLSYYLMSPDSRYSLIVPWDTTGSMAKGKGIYYIDPVAISKSQPEIWRFWFNEITKTVNSTVYAYNPETGVMGDSLRLASSTDVVNRLTDILDYHIVAGNIEDGKLFHRTRGGGTIKVSGTAAGSMQISGAGNIENGTTPVVNKIYDQTKETNGKGNGKTYMINSPLLPSYKSVYKILSEQPEYAEFFKLLTGGDEYDEYEIIRHAYVPAKYKRNYNVFTRDIKVGVDYNVKFFNSFNYTVYAPTNDAVKTAIANGLPTWKEILALPGDTPAQETVKDSLANKLITFLRYHFQDNSVYIDGTSASVMPYSTAAFTITDTGVKKYLKLYTRLTNNGLTLYANPNDQTTAVNVLTNKGLHNTMAREYKFNASDLLRATAIESSSFVVIHPIDKALMYK